MARKETKGEAFQRLAEKRTNAVLDRIRILSNLSNRNAYEYSAQDVQRIFRAIDEELKLARLKMAQNSPRKKFRIR